MSKRNYITMGLAVEGCYLIQMTTIHMAPAPKMMCGGLSVLWIGLVFLVEAVNGPWL